MHTRRTEVVCLLLTLVTGMLSCKKPYHQETERFVFVASNINLPYWKEAQAGFEDAGRVTGVKVEFVGPEAYSPDQQLAAFRQAVAAHPSGIAVAPAQADLFSKDIDAAIQAGIPVVCVDTDAPESKRILFIGTDNVSAGRASGQRMAEILRGRGQIVLITVLGQLNVEERLRGVEEVFKQYPETKISKTIDDKGDPRIANEGISAMLDAKAKLDGILCLEASGGSGAAEALHRLDMAGKIPIVAMDKSPDTLDWIERGSIAATVAQKSYTMAFYSLRFLDDLHHNIVHEFKDWKTAPVSPLPANVDTGTAIIDQSNVNTFKAAAAERRNPL
ncbi:MAG: substrate-binding domain-containing protein [Acidobacteria bacterium]|nr:substrate-binding domain-containing protein [Acidobacteriota bacterium]